MLGLGFVFGLFKFDIIDDRTLEMESMEKAQGLRLVKVVATER